MSKKHDIVQLSVQFIKKHEFNELSFEYLAKQLSVSKTAIHYYFPKKVDLGIAVCDQLATGLKKQGQDFQKHFEKRPWKFIEERMATLEKHDICPIITLQAEYNDLDELMRAQVKSLGELEYQVYVDILARDLPQKEAAITAQVHLSAIKGAQYYSRSLAIPFNRTVLEHIEKELQLLGKGHFK